MQNVPDHTGIDAQLKAMAKSDGYDPRSLLDQGDVHRLIHLANKHGRERTQAKIDQLQAKVDQDDLVRLGQGEHIKTKVSRAELLVGSAIVVGLIGFGLYGLVQMFGGA